MHKGKAIGKYRTKELGGVIGFDLSNLILLPAIHTESIIC